jgi:hypothetical protein
MPFKSKIRGKLMNKFITIFTTILLLNTSGALAHAPQIKTTGKHFVYYEEAKFKKNEITKAFYYIRHGETDANKYNAPISNAPLNKEGIAQAKRAAKLLRDKNIKIIIASPLLRTKKLQSLSTKN